MELAQFKEAQRNAWSAGDYRPVGRLLEDAARSLVTAAAPVSGRRVLDIGTGSGSVAIAAAEAGATVLGVDITDTCFAEARHRAARAGVSVELALGDVESLEAKDASFEVVLSSFAAIFAPRHRQVAAELTRVCRPGGTIGFTAWARGGGNDRNFAALTDHLPAPPEFASSPVLWGDEGYIRELFDPHRVEFGFQRRTLGVRFATTDEFENFIFTNSGPIMAARTALQRLGRWPEAHAAWREAVDRSNEADDGSYRATWDYLLAVGIRR